MIIKEPRRVLCITPTKMKYTNQKQDDYKYISCPKCRNNFIKKDGQRKTENRGLIQRYKCKECNFRFVIDDGFFHMRNNEKKITLCLDLFFRGVSTRKVQEHLKAFYPHNADHKSILRWIIKYSNMIHGFTDSLKLNVGKELQVDEMQYSRRKSHKRKGVAVNWFIDSIDTQTRFMVASEYAKSRNAEQLKQVIKRAKQKTGEQFKVVTTDGLPAYPKIIKKTWGYDNILGKHNVEHRKRVGIKGEGFNIMIERLHNNIRSRTKIFRGFHGSVKSANAIMKGYEIYYNFITKHQSINCSPYELATDLKLENENKWLDLIKLSNTNNLK